MVSCITRFQTFNNICLDRDILEVCIKARCDIKTDEFNFSMESFHKATYRQFILWRFGKLGRGNRRVVPSCAAVLSIRSTYPSPDGRYMGYRNCLLSFFPFSRIFNQHPWGSKCNFTKRRFVVPLTIKCLVVEKLIIAYPE